MKGSLILIEFKNIATAFYILNELTENFNLEVVISKPLCPGRYILVFSGGMGEVSEAEISIKEIKKDSKHSNISVRVIGSIEQGIVEKINSPMNYPGVIRGLGILEMVNSVEIIRAADLLYKSGDIEIISIKIGLGLGAKGIVLVEGTESDLHNGISKIEAEAGRKVISSQIINSPEKKFLDNFKF